MQQEPERTPRKKGGFNWFGLLVFVIIVFGARIVRFVQNLLAGASIQLPQGFDPFLALAGLVVLVAVVSTAAGVLRSAQRRSETRLPTTLQGLPRGSNAPMPPFGGSRTSTGRSMPRRVDLSSAYRSEQQLPQAPRFEPIISGRVLAFGVVGLLVLLGVLGLSGVLGQVLP
jgi:hypothetical protein